MFRLLSIGLGGALGSIARYLVTVWATDRFGEGFPAGTLIVNVLGCFLLGAIMHLSLKSVLTSDQRLFLGTGIMGGLTTYSTFNIETLRFVEDGAWSSAAINFGLTTVACFAAGLAGLALARWWAGS